MYRFIVNILLVVCVSPTLLSQKIEVELLENIGYSESHLWVETTETDTVWSLTISDRDYLKEGMLLFIKTSDNKILKLAPFRYSEYTEIDSITTSPLTGEPIRHCHTEYDLDYEITPTALQYLGDHGVSKMRIGTITNWREKVWKRNEWGKSLAKAYKELKKLISPDYVPPKKPTIYDGF